MVTEEEKGLVGADEHNVSRRSVLKGFGAATATTAGLKLLALAGLGAAAMPVMAMAEQTGSTDVQVQDGTQISATVPLVITLAVGGDGKLYPPEGIRIRNNSSHTIYVSHTVNKTSNLVSGFDVSYDTEIAAGKEAQVTVVVGTYTPNGTDISAAQSVGTVSWTIRSYEEQQAAVSGTGTYTTDVIVRKSDLSNYVTNDALDKNYQKTLTFDAEPMENSTNPVYSGGVYTALQKYQPAGDYATNTVLTDGLSKKQDTLTFDDKPTSDSTNPVTSDGIYDFVMEKVKDLQPGTDGSGNATKSWIQQQLDAKQDSLTFDDKPTSGSTNPVTSGGIYDALQNVDIDVDAAIDANSENPVQNKAVYTALGGKQDKLTFDTAVTKDSANPVTSGGVYDAISAVSSTLEYDNKPTESSEKLLKSGAVYAALQAYQPKGDYVGLAAYNKAMANKQDKLTFDATPTADSTNPVTSGGIYKALQSAGTTYSSGNGATVKDNKVNVNLPTYIIEAEKATKDVNGTALTYPCLAVLPDATTPKMWYIDSAGW